jgi:MFS family permease
MPDLTSCILKKLDIALLTPIRAMKWRYVPLLLIYFSYGLSGFSSIALTFWEKENLALTAEQIISIGVWVFIPWTLKMIFGQLVDSVPIFGSRRKAYIFLGAGCMTLGTLLLIGIASKNLWILEWGSQYTLYLLSAVLTTLGFVIQDVAADTMSTEVVDRTEILNGKQVQRSEKSVQSDFAMVQVLGRLALSLALFSVAGLGGWLAENFSYTFVFCLMLTLPVISCIGAIFIRLENPQNSIKRSLDFKILFGGIAFAIFSIFMAWTDIVWAQEIVFCVSLALIIYMMKWITGKLSSSRKKALIAAMTALFIFRMFTLASAGPGVTWWAIDVLKFDPAFFGILRQIGATVALGFLWLGANFIANRPVRLVLIVLIFFQAIISFPEVGMYYHLHEWLGLEARTVALFDTALESPLTDLSMVPMLALIAFYAPDHYRGTWFAVAASLMNLALTGGKLLTKYLNKIFVVSREVLDEAGNILSTQNYDQLGALMLWKIVLGFFIPLGAILILLKKQKPATKKLQEDISEQPPVPSQKEMNI